MLGDRAGRRHLVKTAKRWAEKKYPSIRTPIFYRTSFCRPKSVLKVYFGAGKLSCRPAETTLGTFVFWNLCFLFIRSGAIKQLEQGKNQVDLAGWILVPVLSQHAVDRPAKVSQQSGTHQIAFPGIRLPIG